MNCYLYSKFKVIWVFTLHVSLVINGAYGTNFYDLTFEVAVEVELVSLTSLKPDLKVAPQFVICIITTKGRQIRCILNKKYY